MKQLPNITLNDARLVFSLLLLLLVGGVLGAKVDLHVVLLLALFLTVSYTLIKGASFDDIVGGMSQSVHRAFEAMFIFILIGALIATFISAGTIPYLIYHGLNLLSPALFLPAGLLICSLTSVATGTSWGTIGTVGVALLGIGESLGIPLPLVAGMIVSGAFFGDKISPMSDTTNLAAAATNTPLYDHIKGMLYTTVPAYVLALVAYALIGLTYRTTEMNPEQVTFIQTTLAATFNLSPLTLLPILTVLALSLLKKPAIFSMSVGVLVGIICAISLQAMSLPVVLNVMNQGYVTQSGSEMVDTLLNRGGIQSMMSTFSLAFIALALGGVLDTFGYLRILVQSVLSRIQRVGSLVFVTISSCALSNAVMGEAYLSIILNGSLYQQAYKAKGLSSQMLSRTLEEGATLTTGLIPWTTAGMFISATLGISAFSYAPFTFYNLLNPLIAILFAYLGIFVLKAPTESKTKHEEMAKL